MNNNYYKSITSMNMIELHKVIDYFDNVLGIEDDTLRLYKTVLTSDLSKPIKHYTNDSNYISIIPNEDVIEMVNNALHSFIINEALPFISKEKDIELYYKPIVDPKKITGYYFKLDVLCNVFHIQFKTQKAYHKFKIKYPEEYRKLDLFTRRQSITGEWI